MVSGKAGPGLKQLSQFADMLRRRAWRSQSALVDPAASCRCVYRQSRRFTKSILLTAVAVALPGIDPAAAQQRSGPERDPEKAAYQSLDRRSTGAPEDVRAAEEKSNSLFDRAIAPVRSLAVSTADAQALNSAFAAINKNKFDEAEAQRAQISDATARKLVDWGILRSGGGTIESYRAFLVANPEWPNRWLLTEHLEAKLLELGDASAVLQHFAKAQPETAVGEAALAAAYAATGRRKEASALASKAWRHGDIPVTYEEDVLKRIGPLLTHADHKWRLDRLLTEEFRWAASRNERAAAIKRQIPRVSAVEQAKAKARLAVFLRQDAAGKLLAALPAEAHTDWGIAYHRIIHLRRAGKEREAAKMLLSAPVEKAHTVNPDAWWDERQVNAYEALEDNNPKLAYELVRDAGPLSVNPLKEQSFLAGWLALRYLGDVKAAIKHFKVMNEAADGPLSRAKAGYWLGRAYAEHGDPARAREYYERAARHFDTFHGQLALQRLAPGAQPLPVLAPQPPTSAQIERFRSSDAVRAAIIADKAGLGRSITRPFLANLGAIAKSEAETALVAHLTRALGDTQQSLRIGKRGMAEGMNLAYYAYPVAALPDYKPLRSPPETAFLLGIARQESEFNTQTVSGAGARGILQVMPMTAKHVCRDYKIKCDVAQLGRDESYNLMIASAYIGDRMGEFEGSYVLGLAGYNAGPGRARQWIKQFGDPRGSRIDSIDWVERIPFQETREYVAKVLSNIQVYRARLGEGSKALRLEQDLARAQARADSPGQRIAPGSRIRSDG